MRTLSVGLITLALFLATANIAAWAQSASRDVYAEAAAAFQHGQLDQAEQMLREAMSALTPQCRRLVEMLFFEASPRPYTEVAAALGLAVGSIGFTRQKCIERLRLRLEELGFR